MAKYKLGEICEFYSGTGFPVTYQGKAIGDFPFYKVGDIANNVVAGNVYLSLCNNYISNQDALEIKGTIIPKDTVVFAKIGEALKLNRRALTSCNCLIDNNAMGIAPKRKFLQTGYFFYFMKNLKLQNFAESTTVPSVRKSKLEQIEIETPPLNTQNEVERTLDKISSLITIRQHQLQKLDELIKARFVELFGDTVLNPFGWEKALLSTVCDVRDGTHDSPSYYETGYPLVTSKNVSSGKINLTDCSLICESDFKKINERSKVDTGDIIMPMIGTIGKPVIVDIEPNFAIKNVALIKFKDSSRVLNAYVRALLMSDYFEDAVLSKVRGGTQKFISLGDIRKLCVLVPPMEKQEQFVMFVNQVDKSKVVALNRCLYKTRLKY